MDLQEKISKLQEIVCNSKNIVFFGGAGVSTESGLKDFRSRDGLYNEHYKYPPEEILSHDFFFRHTEEFYRFYRDKMLLTPDIKPNAAHLWLARREKAGKLSRVITQNIDGLHQAAGSKRVLELHGTVHKNHCLKCGKFYDMDYIAQSNGVPHCDCGGVIKPDVVLYGESLDEDTVSRSVRAIENADTLIVAGTSLTVYPAAGLIRYFGGDNLILINRDATAYDGQADLIINHSVGRVLEQITI